MPPYGLAVLFGSGVISMDQNNVAVTIENLSKVVKSKRLLKPLNYELLHGKILALCGGNGAGKSTLIRLITGLFKPTTGHVMMNGFHHRKDKRQYLKQFGYMPDHFEFQKSITAKETIHFYADIKNISEEKYSETLKEVGLLDKLNEKVGSFSKGMNQRLLLAQALMAEPDILILDEPTNGLDPYWIQQFSQLMINAKNNGQTIIFSTHDLHVAEQIADEVMFLSEGENISHGPIHQYDDIGLYKAFNEHSSIILNKRGDTNASNTKTKTN